MLKVICKHIIHHWKKNIWITLELLIVFCLIWYMVDYFFVLGYNKNLTSHRDLTNTYMVGLGILPEDHKEFQKAESSPSHALENFRRITRRIKEHPEVESVALAAGYYAMPVLAVYTQNYRSTEDTTLHAEVQVFPFIPEEDYFQVFRHTVNQGKTTVSMKDYDWNDPAHILITQMTADQLFPEGSALEKWIEQAEPPYAQFRVAGVIDDIKHFNYLRPYAAMFIPQRMDETNFNSAILAFRTKGNIPYSQFIPAFSKEMSPELKMGNYYLTSLNYFPEEDIKMDYKAGMTNTIRMHTALVIFLFVNILLCVFGTFWYRVHVRREEIGIRRAMGSRISDIQKLFTTEGLILLSIAVLPAMLIEMQFIFAGLIETLGEDIKSYGSFLPDHMIPRFLITNLITWIILAGMVIAGIWYPAYSASNISPTDALRGE